MAEFVHLHLHTEYSPHGMIKIEDLPPLARDLGYKALAITDHVNITGAYVFFEYLPDWRLKPILGCEIYLKGQGQKPYHLVLLCENETGYRNLIELLNLARVQGRFQNFAVSKQQLFRLNEGLIALSGCLQGEIPQTLLEGDIAKARELAQTYLKVFKDRFFLELSDNGLPGQKQVNQALVELGHELRIPVVATNNCHYMRREDALAYDLLFCIRQGKTLEEKDQISFSSQQFHLASTEEMHQRFSWCPEALENSLVIADRCVFSLKDMCREARRFFVLKDRSVADELKVKAYHGLEKGFGN